MGKRMRIKGKYRILAVLLAVSLYISGIPSMQVYAETTKEKLDKAQKEHEETKSKLNETKDNISSLNGVKDSLEGKLDNLNVQLTEVSNNLSDLEEQIKEKEEEISQTQSDLDEAKETEKTQYENMKKRVKFLYEKKDATYAEMLLTSKSFSDFVNKNRYVEELSEYDDKMLKQYKETRKKIEEQEALLQKEKKELDAMKEEVAAQQKKVTGYVNETSSSITQYSGQISEAEEKALAYETQAKAEEENITALKKKLAEEIAMSKLAAQSSWRDISEVSFEEGDRYLLASLIYCEAGGEPYAGQLAVGAVVVNRVLSSVYPDTVVGVIYQNRQFSPVASGRLALALADGRATAACYKAADEAMAGQTNVGNCVYFRTPIEGLTGTQIGGHIFY